MTGNSQKPKTVSAKQLEANRRNAQRSTGPKDTSITRFNALKHGILSSEIVITVGDGKENEEEFVNLLDQLKSYYDPQGAMEEMLVEKIAVAYWRLRRALRYERGMLRERLDSLFYDYRNKENWQGRKINQEVDYDHLREVQKGLIKACTKRIKLLKSGSDLSELNEDTDLEGIDMNEYYFTLIEEYYPGDYWSNTNFKKYGIPEEEMKISNMRRFLSEEGWTDDCLRNHFIRQDLERIERHRDEIADLEEREKAEELKLSRMVDKESLLSTKEMNKLLKYEGTIEKQLYRAINQLERLQRTRKGEIVPPPIHLDVDVNSEK